MNKIETLDILQQIKNGEISPQEALSRFCTEPFGDLSYAKPDYHRVLRQGIPEIIYGEGKTAEQILGVSKAFLEKNQSLILITRLSVEKAEYLQTKLNLTYYEDAHIGIIGEFPKVNGNGTIAVVTAGTSDIPIAKEAVLTAKALGNEVVEIYDVGVAGLHRLLSKLDIITNAQVVIAIAGMEGALASVLGGLVDCPVIGVPTSVGYGASFNGLSALLSMLNSCSSGVCVVNIDNGFGAGYLASIINHQRIKNYENTVS